MNQENTAARTKNDADKIYVEMSNILAMYK